MFEDTYHTITSPSQGLYKEKGSKFLAFAFPVTSVEEVKQHLDRLRKEYFDARHHCYAYVLGPPRKLIESMMTVSHQVRGDVPSMDSCSQPISPTPS